MRMSRVLFAAVCALGIATSAQATTYNFQVNYQGPGLGSLASGSDNMLGISFGAGDTINYTFTSAGTGFWTTLTAGAPSITGAIGDLLGNFGTADFSFAASFLNGGSTVYSQSGSGLQGSADLGPRSLAYPNGLNFDTFSETLNINSLSNGTGTFSSLLPVWAGATPEQFPNFFSFTAQTADVPEPLSLSVFGIGLVGVGVMRRRKKANKA